MDNNTIDWETAATAAKKFAHDAQFQFGSPDLFEGQALMQKWRDMAQTYHALQSGFQRVARASIANTLANAVTETRPTLDVDIAFEAEWGDEGQQYLGASVRAEFDESGAHETDERWLQDEVANFASEAFSNEDTQLKVTYAVARRLFNTNEVETFLAEVTISG